MPQGRDIRKPYRDENIRRPSESGQREQKPGRTVCYCCQNGDCCYSYFYERWLLCCFVLLGCMCLFGFDFSFRVVHLVVYLNHLFCFRNHLFVNISLQLVCSILCWFLKFVLMGLYIHSCSFLNLVLLSYCDL